MKFHAYLPRLIAAVLLVGVCSGCGKPASSPDGKLTIDTSSTSMRPASFEIRDGGKAVEVAGLNADVVKALSKVDWKPEEWSALFALYVEPADGADPTQRPPVLGAYTLVDGVLRFTPRFPLAPGVHYRAAFHPDRVPGAKKSREVVVKSLFLPASPAGDATAVEQVYPTADKLPENQLKFYLHFTAPMSRGEAYRRITLLNADGKEVVGAFLEVSEELWDPEGRRFTLFIDPGRIKRGLKPREDMGPALEQGKTYTLLIDQEWKDAEGRPLKEAFRKTFRATAPDETPPDPKTWQVEAPLAGSRAPLVVVFPKPMEHALLERMLWVTGGRGQTVPGEATVTDAETRWLFTPRDPWKAGAHVLVADVRLEDLAGNMLSRPFEVDVFHPTTIETKAETVETPFEVRAEDKPK